MVNYGADGIFAVGNELCDNDIDELIAEGTRRALNLAIDVLLIFEMNSFFTIDYDVLLEYLNQSFLSESSQPKIELPIAKAALFQKKCGRN